MKKLFIVAVAFMFIVVASTGVLADDSWLSNILDGEDDDITVGFLIKTLQEERYQTDRDAFIEKAEELGAEVIFDTANNNADTQYSRFENMLSRGADVVAIQPVDPEAASRMVQTAHEEGVRVIAYDMLINNCDLDLFVSPDGWNVGTLQGEAMVEWFKEKRGEVKGNIVFLKGQPGGSNVPLFSQGVYDTVEKYPGLEIVVEQGHESWAPDLAMATVENALTRYGDDIDAVVSNNSGMAAGGIRALEAQGLADTEKVFVAGSDADLINMRYIAQGKQTMDVFKKIKPLAEKAAELAVLLAENPDQEVEELVEVDRYTDNGYTDVPVVLTPIVEVNADNIMDTVVADGYHNAEDIYDFEE